MSSHARSTRTPFFALVGVGTLLVLIVVNLLTLWQLNLARSSSFRSREILERLDRVEVALSDAETAERGFLLTGDTEYLEPFVEAEESLPSVLDQVRGLVARDPAQRERVAALRQIAEQKLSVLRRAIEAGKQGRIEEGMVLVRTGQDRLIMNSARQTLTEVRTAETRRLSRRSTRTESYLEAAVGIDLVGALALLIIGVLLFVISRDIARRVALERALREAARFQQQFIGILGHDLRNPLNAILMAAGLVRRRGGLAEPQLATVGRIESSATRMSRMVDQLLDLTRSQLGGGIPIEPTADVDLASVVAATVDELRTAHPDREIRQQTTGDVVGTWDPDRLAQVSSNLVGNAVQHGESPIDVIVRGEDGVVVLEVHNRGPAIPSALVPHLFDPFRRGSTRGHDEGGRAGGLGLGLFISRAIVVAHGGTLDVASSDETGTTFRATLPRV